MRSVAWKGDWPITQPWGPTALELEPRYEGGWWHCGVDVGMPVGTPLYAVRPGTVTHRTSGILGLRTASGEVDYYVHGTYNVLLGAICDKGRWLGASGVVIPGGGSLTGPHLHFEVQPFGTQINTPPGHDPLPVLDPGTYGPGSGTVVPDMTPAESDLLYRIFFMLADPATTDPATAKSKEPWTGQIWDRLKTLDKLATTVQLAAAVADLKTVIQAVPGGAPADNAAVLAAIANVQAIVDKIDRGD